MSTGVTAYTNIGTVTMFISDCPSCGVIFGITTEYEDRRREDHKGWYCPNGHRMGFTGPTDAEKRAARAEESAKQLQAKLIAERNKADAARRDAAEAKASETRLRWRVGHGVCPCCQRSFPALAAHVATKHPDFTRTDMAPLSYRMKAMLASILAASDASESAVVCLDDLEVSNRSTARALESRGLVTQIDYDSVALTDAGWPLAELAAGVA